MATRDEISALLREAEAAYHDLLIGVSVRVVVHQNGQRMEYSPASRGALAAYIAELKRQLDPVAMAPRPMRVFF